MAVKIYRLSDRIPVKIGEITFKLGPMTAEQRIDVMECYETVGGETVGDMVRATMKVIKYSVKDVDGIEYATDEGQYKVQFEDDSKRALSDECVDELLGLEQKTELATVCYAFLNGIPSEIIDPRTKKKLKGVEMLPAEKSEGKKN